RAPVAPPTCFSMPTRTSPWAPPPGSWLTLSPSTPNADTGPSAPLCLLAVVLTLDAHLNLQRRSAPCHGDKHAEETDRNLCPAAGQYHRAGGQPPRPAEHQPWR